MKGRISKKQSARRKELLRFVNNLDLLYNSYTSVSIAEKLTREINGIASYNEQTPEFVDEVRKKLFLLHEYNTQVAKIAYSYPTSKETYELLGRYVALESDVLYKNEYNFKYEKQVEDRVFQTVVSFLKNSFSTEDNCLTDERKNVYNEALKVFVSYVDVKYTSDEEKFPARIVKNILDTLGLIKKSPAGNSSHLDINNPSLIRLKESLRDSDYGSDDDGQETASVTSESSVTVLTRRNNEVKKETTSDFAINTLNATLVSHTDTLESQVTLQSTSSVSGKHSTFSENVPIESSQDSLGDNTKQQSCGLKSLCNSSTSRSVPNFPSSNEVFSSVSKNDILSFVDLNVDEDIEVIRWSQRKSQFPQPQLEKQDFPGRTGSKISADNKVKSEGDKRNTKYRIYDTISILSSEDEEEDFEYSLTNFDVVEEKFREQRRKQELLTDLINGPHHKISDNPEKTNTTEINRSSSIASCDDTFSSVISIKKEITSKFTEQNTTRSLGSCKSTGLKRTENSTEKLGNPEIIIDISSSDEDEPVNKNSKDAVQKPILSENNDTLTQEGNMDIVNPLLISESTLIESKSKSKIIESEDKVTKNKSSMMGKIFCRSIDQLTNNRNPDIESMGESSSLKVSVESYENIIILEEQVDTPSKVYLSMDPTNKEEPSNYLNMMNNSSTVSDIEKISAECDNIKQIQLENKIVDHSTIGANSVKSFQKRDHLPDNPQKERSSFLEYCSLKRKAEKLKQNSEEKSSLDAAISESISRTDNLNCEFATAKRNHNSDTHEKRTNTLEKSSDKLTETVIPPEGNSTEEELHSTTQCSGKDDIIEIIDCDEYEECNIDVSPPVLESLPVKTEVLVDEGDLSEDGPESANIDHKISLSEQETKMTENQFQIAPSSSSYSSKSDNLAVMLEHQSVLTTVVTAGNGEQVTETSSIVDSCYMSSTNTEKDDIIIPEHDHAILSGDEENTTECRERVIEGSVHQKNHSKSSYTNLDTSEDKGRYMPQFEIVNKSAASSFSDEGQDDIIAEPDHVPLSSDIDNTSENKEQVIAGCIHQEIHSKSTSTESGTSINNEKDIPQLVTIDPSSVSASVETGQDDKIIFERDLAILSGDAENIIENEEQVITSRVHQKIHSNSSSTELGTSENTDKHIPQLEIINGSSVLSSDDAEQIDTIIHEQDHLTLSSDLENDMNNKEQVTDACVILEIKSGSSSTELETSENMEKDISQLEIVNNSSVLSSVDDAEQVDKIVPEQDHSTLSSDVEKITENEDCINQDINSDSFPIDLGTSENMEKDIPQLKIVNRSSVLPFVDAEQVDIIIPEQDHVTLSSNVENNIENKEQVIEDCINQEVKTGSSAAELETSETIEKDIPQLEIVSKSSVLSSVDDAELVDKIIPEQDSATLASDVEKVTENEEQAIKDCVNHEIKLGSSSTQSQTSENEVQDIPQLEIVNGSFVKSTVDAVQDDIIIPEHNHVDNDSEKTCENEEKLIEDSVHQQFEILDLSCASSSIDAGQEDKIIPEHYPVPDGVEDCVHQEVNSMSSCSDPETFENKEKNIMKIVDSADISLEALPIVEDQNNITNFLGNEHTISSKEMINDVNGDQIIKHKYIKETELETSLSSTLPMESEKQNNPVENSYLEECTVPSDSNEEKIIECVEYAHGENAEDNKYHFHQNEHGVSTVEVTFENEEVIQNVDLELSTANITISNEQGILEFTEIESVSSCCTREKGQIMETLDQKKEVITDSVWETENKEPGTSETIRHSFKSIKSAGNQELVDKRENSTIQINCEEVEKKSEVLEYNQNTEPSGGENLDQEDELPDSLYICSEQEIGTHDDCNTELSDLNAPSTSVEETRIDSSTDDSKNNEKNSSSLEFSDTSTLESQNQSTEVSEVYERNIGNQKNSYIKNTCSDFGIVERSVETTLFDKMNKSETESTEIETVKSTSTEIVECIDNPSSESQGPFYNNLTDDSQTEIKSLSSVPMEASQTELISLSIEKTVEENSNLLKKSMVFEKFKESGNEEHNDCVETNASPEKILYNDKCSIPHVTDEVKENVERLEIEFQNGETIDASVKILSTTKMAQHEVSISEISILDFGESEINTLDTNHSMKAEVSQGSDHIEAPVPFKIEQERYSTKNCPLLAVETVFEEKQSNIDSLEVTSNINSDETLSSTVNELDVTPTTPKSRCSDSHNVIGNLGKAMLLMSNTEPRRPKRNISFTSPIKMTDPSTRLDTSPTTSSKTVIDIGSKDNAYNSYTAEIEISSSSNMTTAKSSSFNDTSFPQCDKSSLYPPSTFYTYIPNESRDNEVFYNIKECDSQKEQLDIDILASVASNQKPLKVDTKQKKSFEVKSSKSPKNKKSVKINSTEDNQTSHSKMREAIGSPPKKTSSTSNVLAATTSTHSKNKAKPSKSNSKSPKPDRTKDSVISTPSRKGRVTSNKNVDQKLPEKVNLELKINKKTDKRKSRAASKDKKNTKVIKTPEKSTRVSQVVNSEEELIIDDSESDDSLPLNLRMKKCETLPPENIDISRCTSKKDSAPKNISKTKVSKGKGKTKEKKNNSKANKTVENSNEKKINIQCINKKEVEIKVDTVSDNSEKNDQKVVTSSDQKVVTSPDQTKRIVHFKKAILELISQDLDDNNGKNSIMHESSDIQKPQMSNHNDKIEQKDFSSEISRKQLDKEYLASSGAIDNSKHNDTEKITSITEQQLRNSTSEVLIEDKHTQDLDFSKQNLSEHPNNSQIVQSHSNSENNLGDIGKNYLNVYISPFTGREKEMKEDETIETSIELLGKDIDLGPETARTSETVFTYSESLKKEEKLPVSKENLKINVESVVRKHRKKELLKTQRCLEDLEYTKSEKYLKIEESQDSTQQIHPTSQTSKSNKQDLNEMKSASVNVQGNLKLEETVKNNEQTLKSSQILDTDNDKVDKTEENINEHEEKIKQVLEPYKSSRFKVSLAIPDIDPVLKPKSDLTEVDNNTLRSNSKTVVCSVKNRRRSKSSSKVQDENLKVHEDIENNSKIEVTREEKMSAVCSKSEALISSTNNIEENIPSEPISNNSEKKLDEKKEHTSERDNNIDTSFKEKEKTRKRNRKTRSLYDTKQDSPQIEDSLKISNVSSKSGEKIISISKEENINNIDKVSRSEQKTSETKCEQIQKKVTANPYILLEKLPIPDGKNKEKGKEKPRRSKRKRSQSIKSEDASKIKKEVKSIPPEEFNPPKRNKTKESVSDKSDKVRNNKYVDSKSKQRKTSSRKSKQAREHRNATAALEKSIPDTKINSVVAEGLPNEVSNLSTEIKEKQKDELPQNQDRQIESFEDNQTNKITPDNKENVLKDESQLKISPDNISKELNEGYSEQDIKTSLNEKEAEPLHKVPYESKQVNEIKDLKNITEDNKSIENISVVPVEEENIEHSPEIQILSQESNIEKPKESSSEVCKEVENVRNEEIVEESYLVESVSEDSVEAKNIEFSFEIQSVPKENENEKPRELSSEVDKAIETVCNERIVEETCLVESVSEDSAEVKNIEHSPECSKENESENARELSSEVGKAVEIVCNEEESCLVQSASEDSVHVENQDVNIVNEEFEILSEPLPFDPNSENVILQSEDANKPIEKNLIDEVISESQEPVNCEISKSECLQIEKSEELAVKTNQQSSNQNTIEPENCENGTNELTETKDDAQSKSKNTIERDLDVDSIIETQLQISENVSFTDNEEKFIRDSNEKFDIVGQFKLQNPTDQQTADNKNEFLENRAIGEQYKIEDEKKSLVYLKNPKLDGSSQVHGSINEQTLTNETFESISSDQEKMVDMHQIEFSKERELKTVKVDLKSPKIKRKHPEDPEEIEEFITPKKCIIKIIQNEIIRPAIEVLNDGKMFFETEQSGSVEQFCEINQLSEEKPNNESLSEKDISDEVNELQSTDTNQESDKLQERQESLEEVVECRNVIVQDNINSQLSEENIILTECEITESEGIVICSESNDAKIDTLTFANNPNKKEVIEPCEKMETTEEIEFLENKDNYKILNENQSHSSSLKKALDPSNDNPTYGEYLEERKEEPEHALNLSVHDHTAQSNILSEEQCSNLPDEIEGHVQNPSRNELSFSIERMLQSTSTSKPKEECDITFSEILPVVETFKNANIEQLDAENKIQEETSSTSEITTNTFKHPGKLLYDRSTPKTTKSTIVGENEEKKRVKKKEKSKSLKTDNHCKVIVERVFSMDELAGGTPINPCINYYSAPIFPISTELIPYRYGVYGTVVPPAGRSVNNTHFSPEVLGNGTSYINSSHQAVEVSSRSKVSVSEAKSVHEENNDTSTSDQMIQSESIKITEPQTAERNTFLNDASDSSQNDIEIVQVEGQNDYECESHEYNESKSLHVGMPTVLSRNNKDDETKNTEYSDEMQDQEEKDIDESIMKEVQQIQNRSDSSLSSEILRDDVELFDSIVRKANIDKQILQSSGTVDVSDFTTDNDCATDIERLANEPNVKTEEARKNIDAINLELKKIEEEPVANPTDPPVQVASDLEVQDVKSPTGSNVLDEVNLNKPPSLEPSENFNQNELSEKLELDAETSGQQLIQNINQAVNVPMRLTDLASATISSHGMKSLDNISTDKFEKVNDKQYKSPDDSFSQSNEIEPAKESFSQNDVSSLFNSNIGQPVLSETFVNKVISQTTGTDGMESLLTSFQSAISETIARNISLHGSFSLFSNSDNKMQFPQTSQAQNEGILQVNFQEKTVLPIGQSEAFINNRLGLPQSTPIRPQENTQGNDSIFNMSDDIFDFDFNSVNQGTTDNSFTNSYVNTTMNSENLPMIFYNPSEFLDLLCNFGDIGCEVTVDNTNMEDIVAKPNEYISTELIQKQLIDSIPPYIAEEEFDSNAPSFLDANSIELFLADPMVGGQKELVPDSKQDSNLDEVPLPESALSFDEDMMHSFLHCEDNMKISDKQIDHEILEKTQNSFDALSHQENIANFEKTTTVEIEKTLNSAPSKNLAIASEIPTCDQTKEKFVESNTVSKTEVLVQLNNKEANKKLNTSSKASSPSTSMDSNKSINKTTVKKPVKVQKIPASKYAPPKKPRNNDTNQSKKQEEKVEMKQNKSLVNEDSSKNLTLNIESGHILDMPQLLSPNENSSLKRKSLPSNNKTDSKTSKLEISETRNTPEDSATQYNMYDRTKAMKRNAAKVQNYSKFYDDDSSSSNKNKKRKLANKPESSSDKPEPHGHSSSPSIKEKSLERRGSFGEVETQSKKPRIAEASTKQLRKSEPHKLEFTDPVASKPVNSYLPNDINSVTQSKKPRKIESSVGEVRKGESYHPSDPIYSKPITPYLTNDANLETRSKNFRVTESSVKDVRKADSHRQESTDFSPKPINSYLTNDLDSVFDKLKNSTPAPYKSTSSKSMRYTRTDRILRSAQEGDGFHNTEQSTSSQHSYYSDRGKREDHRRYTESNRKAEDLDYRRKQKVQERTRSSHSRPNSHTNASNDYRRESHKWSTQSEIKMNDGWRGRESYKSQPSSEERRSENHYPREHQKVERWLKRDYPSDLFSRPPSSHSQQKSDSQKEKKVEWFTKMDEVFPLERNVYQNTGH